LFSRFFKKLRLILDVRKPTIIQSRELTRIQAEELEINPKFVPIIILVFGFLEKLALMSSNGIIAITKGVLHYLKVRLNSYGTNSHDFIILPCTVDLNIFKKNKGNLLELKSKNNIAEKDKVILYLGSISVGRDFQKILKKFSEILDEGYMIKFVILGRIDPSLSNLIDVLDIRSRTIVKYIPHHHISNYINLADVCLSYIPDTPTYRYSCPLKVLEYMAMEKPVVATNIEAHNNLIKDRVTGIITNCDENDFMNGVINLLNKPDLCKKIGENARIFVEENYSIQVIGYKYKDFLESVLQKRN
jgi:glycosyltransferase involved in cell wall biosynthesis